MGYHNDSCIRQTKRLSLKFGSRLKNMRADDHCRNAVLFELDDVVKTPRRAGASISAAGDYNIAACDHLLKQVRRNTLYGHGLAAA